MRARGRLADVNAKSGDARPPAARMPRVPALDPGRMARAYASDRVQGALERWARRTAAAAVAPEPWELPGSLPRGSASLPAAVRERELALARRRHRPSRPIEGWGGQRDSDSEERGDGEEAEGGGAEGSAGASGAALHGDDADEPDRHRLSAEMRALRSRRRDGPRREAMMAPLLARVEELRAALAAEVDEVQAAALRRELTRANMRVVRRGGR